MKNVLAAVVLFCALAVSACVPMSSNSSTGWGQIAAGVGAVIGETQYDAKVAKASQQLAQYCGALQAVAVGATLFAPEKQRAVAGQAAAAVNSVCSAPPTNVATALTAAVKAYEAVIAAGKAADVPVQPVSGA